LNTISTDMFTHHLILILEKTRVSTTTAKSVNIFYLMRGKMSLAKKRVDFS
jgi:hypothetical protein